MNLNRVLLKDVEDNLFRLFRFGLGIDKYNEPFIKIVFPWMKGRGFLLENSEELGARRPDDIFSSSADFKFDDGLCEFSYHFT